MNRLEPKKGERECPSCALPIDVEAEECPYCGYDLPRQKSSVRIVAIVMAILLIWPLIKLLQYVLG
jgi:predicted amidophosphoribosyltransferase